LREIVLKLVSDVRFPVDGASISPDVFAGKSVEMIKRLSILVGNREKRLSDIFQVSGEVADSVSDQGIVLAGNVGSFRGIGKGMSGGVIASDGDAGFNIGEEMSGGKITMKGSVGRGAGTSMKGGLIEVHGNAGDQIGGSYRGTGKGMSGGSIVVHGNAGYELGSCMQGGFICVAGKVGQFAGVRMRGGEILIEGSSEGRLGADMFGGKVVVLGRVPDILPSFTFEEVRNRATAGDKAFKGNFYLFRGDLNEGGSGRLFVSADANVHLKYYEKFV